MSGDIPAGTAERLAKTAKELPRMLRLSHQQVATALIKEYHVHEGRWRLYLGFGTVGGLNANINGRQHPAAIIPVVEMGLMRDEDPASTLTVDAAEVNPRSLVTVN